MNHTCSACEQCRYSSSADTHQWSQVHNWQPMITDIFCVSKCQKFILRMTQALHNQNVTTQFCFQYWNYYAFQKWPFLLNMWILQVLTQLLSKQKKMFFSKKCRKIPVPTRASEFSGTVPGKSVNLFLAFSFKIHTFLWCLLINFVNHEL